MNTNPRIRYQRRRTNERKHEQAKKATHLGLNSPPGSSGQPHMDPSASKAVTQAPLSPTRRCLAVFLKPSKTDAAKPAGSATFPSHATTRPAAPKQASCAGGAPFVLQSGLDDDRSLSPAPSNARLRDRRLASITGASTSPHDKHSEAATGRQNAAPQTPASWNALTTWNAWVVACTDACVAKWGRMDTCRKPQCVGLHCRSTTQ